MPQTPDPTTLAASFVNLIHRFTGNQPDALAQMRRQIEGERDAGRRMMENADAQLAALNQLEALIGQQGVDPVAVGLALPPPPLKTAILRILNEDRDVAWDRDVLYQELVRRGWGPGGANPRNTFTARLRDLELDGRLQRLDRDIFKAKEETEVLA